ncbi:MAG: ABC transporter permease [Desulfobacteraceae bacterium]|nr:ABC transporter permease [Desulfobacteraceae bacterium]
MNLMFIIRKELFERKQQLFTSFLTILLGVTAIVSINTITHSSQEAVKKELEQLGANVLILPRNATVQSYYAADLETGELPDSYVSLLSNSGIHGMDNLSPKLSSTIEIQGKSFILTGILPKNEIQSKTFWQGSGLFGGTGQQSSFCLATGLPDGGIPKENSRLITELQKDQILIGYEAASILNLSKGDSLTIKDYKFSVASILPASGTVDDTRIFTHLSTAQEILEKPGKINVIEVIGCCQKIFEGLVPKINALLPLAKVLTIGHVVETQIKTNKMMEKTSWAFISLIILVGGAGIANYMYGNVNDRKKEIGTLMAIGAGSGFILKLFFAKALFLGVVGGVGGFITGTVMAVFVGPYIANIPVAPLPYLIGLALLISVGIAMVASFFPALRASKVDPCVAFKEV